MILSVDAYLCGSDSCWVDAHMVMGACMHANVLLRIVPFAWLKKEPPMCASEIEHMGITWPDTKTFTAAEVAPPIFVVRRWIDQMGVAVQTLSGDCWPALDRELSKQASDS